MNEKIKEALEKQMELLAERSSFENIDVASLATLTNAMVEIAKVFPLS